jgi:AbrB family looped-hinge helix DNA binding protein
MGDLVDYVDLIPRGDLSNDKAAVRTDCPSDLSGKADAVMTRLALPTKCSCLHLLLLLFLPVRSIRGFSMFELATTKMSSKGQVVIPDEIRRRLGLKEGSQFVVVGEKDTVILKTISPPSMQEFDHLIAKARGQARKTALKRSDVGDAVLKVRGRK